MGTKRFGTTTVEIDARDVLDDRFGGLDCDFGGGGTDLIDEMGFFDRMGGEHGARFSIVRDDAGVGWIQSSDEGSEREKLRTVDDAFCV